MTTSYSNPTGETGIISACPLTSVPAQIPFTVSLDITKNAFVAADILSGKYFSLDPCAGVNWSGDGLDNIFVTTPSFLLFANGGMTTITVTSLLINLEFDGTQGALNILVDSSNWAGNFLDVTISIPANATTASVLVPGITTQFNWWNNFEISHNITPGFTWGVTTIVAGIV